MKLIKRIISIALLICLTTSSMYAFSFTNGIVRPTVFEIQKSIEEEYGLNIILPQNSSNYINIDECMTVVENGLSHFPKGIIKEITDAYEIKGIKTNIIINKTDNNLLENQVTYEKTNLSVNITINILTNDFYGITDVISSDGVILEISHFICDYLIEIYGYENLKLEFNKINSGYEYGTWGIGYEKVFLNQNSATCLNEDIANLIWYAENHPEIILNASSGKRELIYEKIKTLAQIMDKSFESITLQTKLWLNTVPSNPDYWAEKDINKMFDEGLIPKEFQGKYESYISRVDFCTLALNVVKSKIGEEKFYQQFEILKPQRNLIIDPINGEIIENDFISNVFYDIKSCKNKEDIYEAYKIGLLGYLDGGKFEPESNVTRLEVAKISTAICEIFNIELVRYETVNFDDIKELNESEKPYIYFAINAGLLKESGNKVKPYDYCTYQEAYLMLNIVYEMNI